MRFDGELLPDDPPPPPPDMMTDPDTLDTRDAADDRRPPSASPPPLAAEPTEAASPTSRPTKASALDGPPHAPSPSAGSIACNSSSEHGTDGVPDAGADDGRRECDGDDDEFDPRATDDERAEESGSAKKTGPVECVGDGGTDGGGLTVRRATMCESAAGVSMEVTVGDKERFENGPRGQGGVGVCSRASTGSQAVTGGSTIEVG